MKRNMAKSAVALIIVVIMLLLCTPLAFAAEAVETPNVEAVQEGQPAEEPVEETKPTQEADKDEITEAPPTVLPSEEQLSLESFETLNVLTQETVDEILGLALTDGLNAALKLNEYVDDSNFLNAVFAVIDKYYVNYDETKAQLESFLANIHSSKKAEIDAYLSAKTESFSMALAERQAEELDYIPGEILVVFDNDNKRSAANEELAEYRMEVLEEINTEQSVAVVEIPDDKTVAQAIEEVQGVDEVKHAQPNFIYRTTALDTQPEITNLNDPLASQQWHLNQINVKTAWDISRVDKRVKVAVIDTGANVNHEDLVNNLSPLSRDMVTNTKLTGDADTASTHGTHVAGIIAAQANNSKGVAGVSYNAEIIALNVFQPNVNGDIGAASFTIIRGIQYAVENGAKVINMSLGKYQGDANDVIYEQAINDATARGVVCVASGGNGDKYHNPITSFHIPSDFEACIAVVPTDSDNTRPSWADYNQYKDISAPGVGIISTALNGYYSLTGSSQAAPVVSGVVAMMLAKNPSLSVSSVKDVLYSTATRLKGTSGRNDYYGYGLINAEKALNALGSITEPTSVSVSAGSSEVAVGSTLQMSASVSPSNATNKSVTWSVNNGNARISSSGVLTGVSSGNVTVRATASNGIYGEKTIRVMSGVDAFVTRMYRVCLSREPDASGLSDWRRTLESGSATGADLAYGFIFSKEFIDKNLSDTDYLKALYEACFGRGADANGLAAWQKVLRDGYSRLFVLSGFVNSQEFGKLCADYGIKRGDLSVPADEGAKAFVTRFYRVCLSREPDAQGLQAWAIALTNKTVTGSSLAYGFIFSPEFTSKNVSNSEYIKVLYRTLLGREADGGGLQAWEAVLNRGESRETIFWGFAKSPEFAEICARYNWVP